MTSDISSIVQAIRRDELTAVARQATGRAALEVGDWRVSRLGGGAGNPVSVGLHRFEGAGQDRDELVAWSVILKVIQSPANAGWVDMGEGADQTHWNYWRRELLVFRSGLLETLPAGLTAPRCFGTAELPGDIALLWLEDIRDSYAGAWPLARYALTARHLGRLNGMQHAAQPAPALPWFNLHLTRQWIATGPHWRTLPWDHPRVLRRYPRPETNAFRRLLQDHARILARLEQMPQALSHGDTYPTNFMSRTATGGEQTVALDWALMGIQPLGDDLGQLVFGAQANLGETSPATVTEALFESYLDGLRDSGCHTAADAVRFGFTASAALRVGLFQVLLLGEELRQGGADAAPEAADAGAPDCFEVTMAKAAYELLDRESA